jgi:putative ABC transport system ATP-binding protein
VEVAFRNVSLRRGGASILKDISFSTEGRDFFLIYGPSGSGKTSLLRLINRLDDFDSGDIIVGGRSVRSFSPGTLRRRVGMIFQEPRLFDGTVGENVTFAARWHGMDVDLEGLLAGVGLAGAAPRDVRSLSGGEQQRAALARALAVDPDILLMDEPTSSLDEQAALAVESLLAGLDGERGLKTLFVTHSREQLQRLGGEGILLERGQVAGRGNLLELAGRDHA